MGASPSREHAIDAVRRVLLQRRQDMGVRVHRDADIGVPEPLLDYLGMHTLDEEQRGRGVPEIVESNRRQAGPLQQGAEAAPDEVLLLDWSADLVREHEIEILPRSAGDEPLLQLPDAGGLILDVRPRRSGKAQHDKNESRSTSRRSSAPAAPRRS